MKKISVLIILMILGVQTRSSTITSLKGELIIPTAFGEKQKSVSLCISEDSIELTLDQQLMVFNESYQVKLISISCEEILDIDFSDDRFFIYIYQRARLFSMHRNLLWLTCYDCSFLGPYEEEFTLILQFNENLQELKKLARKYFQKS